jgi:hypothetical protein
LEESDLKIKLAKQMTNSISLLKPKEKQHNTSSGLPNAGVPERRMARVAFCTTGNKILLRVAVLDFM